MSTKKCPQCAENINADAVKCEFCGADLPPAAEEAHEEKKRKEKTVPGSFVKKLFTLESEGMFSPVTALILSLIFTPVFGAYFNFRAWSVIGDAVQVKQAKVWLIGYIAGTVMCFFLLPFWLYCVLAFAALAALFFMQTKKLSALIREKGVCVDPNIKIWLRPAIIAAVPVA